MSEGRRACRRWVEYLLVRLGHDPTRLYLPSVSVTDSLTEEILTSKWLGTLVEERAAHLAAGEEAP